MTINDAQFLVQSQVLNQQNKDSKEPSRIIYISIYEITFWPSTTQTPLSWRKFISRDLSVANNHMMKFIFT